MIELVYLILMVCSLIVYNWVIETFVKNDENKDDDFNGKSQESNWNGRTIINKVWTGGGDE